MNICVSKKKSLILQRIVLAILLIILSGLVACQPTAQNRQATKDSPTADSAMIAQMEKNLHMADLADKVCLTKVKESERTYVMDEWGFWYTKTVRQTGDSVQVGQEVAIHMQIKKLNGQLLLDTKQHIKVGEEEQIRAVEKVLQMMRTGEQMQIIAPWYTAYGINGTDIIEPYSNLEIILTIE